MLKRLLLLDKHVCPWWLAYTFDNPLRRRLHNPNRILAGLVDSGQTVVDIGCGMGHFTLAMARLVGPEGVVIAVDLQKKMLEKVRQRAQQADLLTRIRLHQNTPASIGLEEPVDFALAFWMVHEVANKEAFFREVRDLLKPTARFLVVEPKIHVKASAFDRIVGMARAAGLQLCSEVQVAISRAALLAP